ncbi:leucine-rich repeat domain-containing protein, partial [Romboutsia sp.]|uniref:leucine-rich repeat domain-containing protein n=1 Tax=Romboutsia sp. TaxID=1965302 RepID=UPI003F6658DF
MSVDNSDLLQEITIKDVPLDVDITSPIAHRKVLFRVPKTMITYPILKSRTLKTVLNNSLIKDFQLENSLDKEIISVKNPCGDNLPQIKGEYFLDNQYIVCTVSYFASLIGDGDVVYTMEEDALTLLPFLYCGYETIPNPTIYDFEVILTTPDVTLDPIDETEEYYIYQMSVDVSISLLPLIEINPTDSPLLPELNSKLDKPDGNNKFTHGELSTLLILEFDYVDIPSTIFKDILKYFVDLEKLSLSNCSYVDLYKEMFNLANLRYLILDGNSISSLHAEISLLTKLQYLKLDYNELTTLPDELTNLTSLQSLFIYYN